MKTARTIGLVVLMVTLVASLSFAKPSKALIVNSAHDLRAGFNNQYAYTLCNFCHIAHKTAADTYPTYIGPVLWNHTLSSVSSYGVYSSNTFNSYGTDISDLGALNGAGYTSSNMCLSCHDGTIAVASFYGAVGSVTQGQTYKDKAGNTFVNMLSSATIKDLTNTHPVNFTYYGASWIPNAGVLAPASVSSVDGAGAIPLENGKMQCWTCHDAHNGASGIFEQNFPAQSSGTFCTYCHL